MLTVSAVALVLPAVLFTGVNAEVGPPRCAVVDSIGRCLVSAVDPGRRTDVSKRRSRDADAEDEPVSTRPGKAVSGGQSEPPPTPPPRPVTAFPVGNGGWGQRALPDLPGLLGEPRPDAPGVGDASVAPEVLAQRAVEQLSLPPPVLHTSAGGSGFVGVPMWLWIDGGTAYTGPVSATATAGAARVTATAELSAVEWSMGPPGEIVRCAGPGTPWAGQDGPSPDCGYTYLQRSLPDRTAGTGRWNVVTTSVWTVTWAGFSAGAPVAGDQTVRVSTGTTLAVGEIQVLVDGDGS